MAKKKPFKDILPIFFDLNEINNSNLKYYIPQIFNDELDVMVQNEKENLRFHNNIVILTQEKFYYLVEDNFSLFYYPMLVFCRVLDFSMATDIIDFYDKKLSNN